MTYDKLLKHELLSASEERHLIGKAHNGCEQSRERLILLNQRLVNSICLKYATETVTDNDLRGDGTLGLMKAIDKMDLTLGTRLSTYATYWIHQAVRRSSLLETTIRLPEYKAVFLRKIQKVMTELAQQGNLEPSNEEIADLIDDTTPQEVAEMRLLKATTLDALSFDAAVPGDNADDDFSFADILGYEDRAYEDIINEIDLDFFLSKLQPHEAFVLTRSYGVRRKMKVYEIAEAVGCYRHQVPGIRKRALAKCQRIAEYLKSRPLITGNENWAYIMADPIEAPQMEFLSPEIETFSLEHSSVSTYKRSGS